MWVVHKGPLPTFFANVNNLLNLPVCGGAVTGSEVEAHVKEGAERSEEVGCEFGAAVRGNVERDAVLRKYMGNKGISDVYGGSSICSRNKYAFLRETVDNH